MPPKKKRELVRFRPRLREDKRRRQNRFAAKEWASKLAESDMGSYYNQESSWKTNWNYRGIVFHEFVSERSELFSSQARGEVTRGPAPYKNRTKYCFEILFSGKEASRKTTGSGLEGLEGYFRDSGFDQNTVRESGKRLIYWRDPGFDCSPESGTRQKLGTGCGIYVCMSVGNAGNRHDPPVLAAKANQPGER